MCDRFEQQQYDKRYIPSPLPRFSLSITVIIYPTFQLSKIKKTLSVGLQKTRICVKVWTYMCTHVRVCCHFIEKESIFLLCDFSFHPLLCEPECVYWNYFPRTENYIAHNCRLSSSRFILQTQKRLLLYSFKINDCRIFCVFLSLFISSVNVRVCYVPLFFCLFLSFFYLCYIFYFDVSCMYVWVLRVHSTTIIVYFIPSLTTTSLSQSSCVLTKYKNKKDIFPSFLSHSLSWMLTFLDSLQWRLKIWREIDLLSV